MPVAHKTEINPIDGTPVKRMFWSIISDYDLQTGISELIDNAIDIWTHNGRNEYLDVAVVLDADRQLISVRDNAGGIKHQDLHLLITPGGSNNNPNDEVIGIFGVGGKRASIALGERVEIRTRYKSETSFQLDITKDWLDVDDWEIPVYEIPDVEIGTTEISISHLRKRFDQNDIDIIIALFGQTYNWFISEGLNLTINDLWVPRSHFDNWAYPEAYLPRTTTFNVVLGDEQVQVKITAGLIIDRDPERENYGVYIYCNNRLIVKELRTRDVGYYVTTEAGVPHPDASLCRAIVELQGPAKLMPWNSSKTGINTSHPIFLKLRPSLIQLVSYFSSLSRRLRNGWDTDVIPYTTGELESIIVDDLKPGKRMNLPVLPRAYKQQSERLKGDNKKILKDQPWTLGLVEAIAMVSIITRQRLDTKNRMALILLDSNLEIALKEFIVHRTDLYPTSTYNDTKIQTIFKNRTEVIKEVTDHISIPIVLLDKTRHYYAMRNKLIHERATVGITDNDIENYCDTIQEILEILFDLKFDP